jgi:2-oxoglutarate/2-oxoacid ferredoxin oxidoreductase subunit beta
MLKHPMLKYLKEEGPCGPRLPFIMCPGCGAGQVLNYTLQAVDSIITEGEAKKEEFVFISGVGCSSRLTSHYLNFDSGWTIHGRALAIATGVLLANPKLNILVFTGDGDAAAIGGNHFIHAFRRNINVTVICMNNGLYGMTGGQVAPTTLSQSVTSTTPYGNIEDAFDLCQLAQSSGASYVARWTTAHPQKTIKAIKKAIGKKGASFIEILSQCPVHKKQTPVDMIRALKAMTVSIKKAEGSGKIPVGEFCDTSRPEWTQKYETIIEKCAGRTS